MHLYRLPDGRRWRVIVSHRGQRRSAIADRKADARRLGIDLLAAMGGTPTRGRATVANILDQYVIERGARWSPGYRADVDAIVDRLPAELLGRRASSVTPTTVTALYRTLGWSPHRLRRLHEILSAAWSTAVKLELADTNPIAKIAKPAKPPHKLRIPSHNDVAAILAAADGSERLALRIAATVGARRGEIVALRWDDVTLDTATLVVRRSLAYSPAAGVVEGDTKTHGAGHRVVALDLPTVTGLRKLRARQTELALAGRLTPVWVFSDDAGVTPWRPDRLTHIFAAARHRAGVTGVRLHDLRHYVATTMLYDGETAHDVAAQLGHASTATTLAVYAHHLPGRGRESVERRAARLDGAGS